MPRSARLHLRRLGAPKTPFTPLPDRSASLPPIARSPFLPTVQAARTAFRAPRGRRWTRQAFQRERWIADAALETPAVSYCGALVAQCPRLTTMPLGPTPPGADTAPWTLGATCAVSRALATRFHNAHEDLLPLLCLWARQGPVGRAALLVHGGLAVDGTWWGSEGFAEGALEALGQIPRAQRPRPLTLALTGAVQSWWAVQWPLATWLGCVAIAWEDRTSPMDVDRLLRALRQRQRRGDWSPHAADLVPFLTMSQGAVRVWAQTALAEAAEAQGPVAIDPVPARPVTPRAPRRRGVP